MQTNHTEKTQRERTPLSITKKPVKRLKAIGICKKCHARFYTEDSWEFHRTQYHLAQDKIPDSIRKLQKERFFKGVEG